jgi:hypothetical protein
MDKIVKTENKKRGRKKKEITNSINLPNTDNYNLNNHPYTNIQLIREEPPINIIDDIFNPDNNTDKPHIPKKRGRKPKGGNLISKQPDMNVIQNMVANVILHLKCSSTDLIEYNNQLNKLIIDPLIYNPNIPPNILTYTNSAPFFNYIDNDNVNYPNLTNNYIESVENDNNIDIPYHITDSIIPLINVENTNDTNNNNNNNNDSEIQCHTTNNFNNYAYVENENTTCKYLHHNNINNNLFNNIEDKHNYEDRVNIKDINNKLKKLKINFYKNTLTDKKSACFWCTYDYDNYTCYIPKYEIDGNIHGYGSFCRPECAVAYLMKENIDDSTKFERYHLLNQVYSKIYDYNKNIKPSPNPYYLLDKFYGNLSIQEYRKLLKSEHLLLVIDKPLTRILPELHEDNEDIMLNLYGNIKQSIQSTNNSGVYKVKRQSERQLGPSKSSIILEKFGGN